jgi:recombination protein RecT
MANEIATADAGAKPIVQFRSELEARASELKMALPSGITPEKFQRTVITAVQQNPDLLSASRQSLILACMKAAQDGLLPDGREAALVIFNQNKKVGGDWVKLKLVQYMPMVYGLRKKILQARDAKGEPIVSALEVGVVYRKEVEQGYFFYEIGTEPPLRHRPMLDLTAEDTKDELIVGAYSIATMSDGTRSYEFMRRFEIDKIRQMSQTGATGRTVQYGNDKGKPIEPKGPWVEWFPEMAKKTVMRRHSKTLPMSGDLILDFGEEDDELNANMSSAALLSAPGDEGTLIEDESGDLIDTSTGEVIDAEVSEEKAKPKGKGRKADQQPKAEGAGASKAAGATASENQADSATAGEAEQKDELGITKPAEREAQETIAERILGDMAKAELVADVDRIYAESEAERTGLDDDIYDALASGYQRHRRRLGAASAQAPAQHEPVK